MKRRFFILCGWLSLSLGVIGIFLPLLPTTPFVLLASACFSRGSTRIHTWLRHHPRFGSMIVDWEKHRVIRPRAKWIATVMIVAMFTYPIGFSSLHIGWRIGLASIGIAVITFIHTRRSHIQPTDKTSAVTC